MAFMRDKGAVTKLFGELAERYSQRNGGYTRVLKVGLRHGDCAPMSLIEFVDAEQAPAERPSPRRSWYRRRPLPRQSRPQRRRPRRRKIIPRGRQEAEGGFCRGEGKEVSPPPKL